jgi:hypothetical protein
MEPGSKLTRAKHIVIKASANSQDKVGKRGNIEMSGRPRVLTSVAMPEGTEMAAAMIRITSTVKFWQASQRKSYFHDTFSITVKN